MIVEMSDKYPGWLSGLDSGGSGVGRVGRYFHADLHAPGGSGAQAPGVGVLAGGDGLAVDEKEVAADRLEVKQADCRIIDIYEFYYV
jgi:hypothetical protein